jgi:hypothetical protein
VAFEVIHRFLEGGYPEDLAASRLVPCFQG